MPLEAPVRAVIGNELAPWLADHYLARTAIRGQQVDDMPVSPDRPDNLYEPLPSKAATHGSFNDEASQRSPLLWADPTGRPWRRPRARQ